MGERSGHRVMWIGSVLMAAVPASREPAAAGQTQTGYNCVCVCVCV